MKKWLCVWKKEVVGSPRAVEVPLKSVQDPVKVIRSLGFDPDSRTLFTRKSSNGDKDAHPKEYEMFMPFHVDRDVLVRFEGGKGDRTHYVIVDATQHRNSAKLWASLDQRHNEYMTSYDSFLPRKSQAEQKLSPEEIRRRICGVRGSVR